MVTNNVIVCLSVILTSLCQCSGSPPQAVTQPTTQPSAQECPTVVPPSTITSNQCSQPTTARVKFSLLSSRNQTGHWVAQVKVEHEDEPTAPGSDHQNTDHWQVDVEQRKVKCAGVNTVQTVATISAPPPKAAPGYEHFPGVGYYKFHKEGKTWDEARKVCEEEGGYLVVINSEAESTVLQELFNREPKIENVNHNEYIFIGFHDRYVEGEFLTIFGSSLPRTGFTRWSSPGQPDNGGGNENCGSMYRLNGGLNDIPCPWKLAFICEQEVW